MNLSRAPAAGGGVADIALAGAVPALGPGGAAAGAAGPWRAAFGFEASGRTLFLGVDGLAGGHQAAANAVSRTLPVIAAISHAMSPVSSPPSISTPFPAGS